MDSRQIVRQARPVLPQEGSQPNPTIHYGNGQSIVALQRMSRQTSASFPLTERL